jgi:signal transduction histidine kinase
MRKLRDIPIKQKLIVILMATTMAALLVAGVGIVVSDSFLFRQSMGRDLSALTQMIADISTAEVAFEDQRAAEETLAALRARPHVVAACLYLEENTELARYARGNATTACPTPSGPGEVAFGKDDLTVRRPVMLNGRRIGTLTLLYDLDEIAARRRIYGAAVLGLLLLASALALLLTSRLRAVIETPISHLAQTAAKVGETQDYGIRAQKLSGDELGLLTDAFNAMLARIQLRDQELRAAKEQLEARVAERTVDLENELAERRRAEAELERSNSDQQQFAYVASHDLQEPLRMVYSYMNLIAEQYSGKLDAEADEFIGYAVDGARRMRQLITDLLEYSRVGRRGRELQRTDCGALLKEVRANLELTIAESKAVVTNDALPVVMAEPLEIRQLLQNLIANAIKFRTAEAPRVHIIARREGNWWHFSVMDNGIGIDAEHHRRIFVIFQRLHDRMTYAGTGIGLAICNKIVTRMGGRIWVESEPGKGSVFHFTMPANAGDAVSSEAMN